MLLVVAFSSFLCTESDVRHGGYDFCAARAAAPRDLQELVSRLTRDERRLLQTRTTLF